MATAGPSAMNTDLLTLTQWLSPAFPTGAFAWSHGLEALVADGTVAGEAGFARWLRDVLAEGVGRTDAVILAAVLAGADADEMADLGRALAPSAERLAETMGQGTAFARTLAEQGLALPDAPMPVVLGLAARGLNVAPETVVSLYLQGFATNLVQIAIRLSLVGQSRAQVILTGLQPLIRELATRAVGAEPADIASFTPGADLAAMRHETLDVRLWKS